MAKGDWELIAVTFCNVMFPTSPSFRLSAASALAPIARPRCRSTSSWEDGLAGLGQECSACLVGEDEFRNQDRFVFENSRSLPVFSIANLE